MIYAQRSKNNRTKSLKGEVLSNLILTYMVIKLVSIIQGDS